MKNINLEDLLHKRARAVMDVVDRGLLLDARRESSPLQERSLAHRKKCPVFDRGCVVSATNHLVFAEFER
jgi:hypothetical protein